ncbi:glutamine amidotransferase-like uncharacterized protein [Pseudomonas alcaligenes]|nr:glutamine amidotransferase-like uncharacterized protein [Pseudomonas alcaligenes]
MNKTVLAALALVFPLLAKAEVAVIFDGAGTCDGCGQTVAELLRKERYTVRLVDEDHLSADVLEDADLYVQPGGSDDIMDTLSELSASQVQAIRDFVAQGGQYLGICAGGYLAGGYADEKERIPAFGLVELAEVDQEIPKDNAAQFISIQLPAGHEQRDVYYQAGPHFGSRLPAGAEAMAYYTQSRRIAARISSYGNGTVGLIGPHYEADSAWYAADGLPPDAKQHQDLLLAMLAQMKLRHEP